MLRAQSVCVCAAVSVCSYWLALSGAVGTAGAQQVEAAAWVQAAAALPAVTQTILAVLHQGLTRSQHTPFTVHTHGFSHW